MSRDMVKGLIDLIPDKDMDTIYKVIVKFIPEEPAEPEELEAIAEAKADTSPTIPHNAINWD